MVIINWKWTLFVRSFACANLRNLEYLSHLKERVVDELNETEKEKLNYVTLKKVRQRGR